MAGSKRPSFLKRQKEQQRLARAAEKREARRQKKHSRGMVIEEPGAFEALDPSDPLGPPEGTGEESDPTEP